MRAIAGLWRWRRNPLRRGTDLLEAWTALAALVLIAVAVAVCRHGHRGPLAGRPAHLRAGAARGPPRDRRHGRAEGLRSPARPRSRDRRRHGDAHSRVLARWTGPDGIDRSGDVVARLGAPRPGDHFRLWTDERGRVVGRPLDTATATTHAALAGLGAAAASVALVEGARRLVLWRVVQGRYARLDRAWAAVGPDWGRTGTGS